MTHKTLIAACVFVAFATNESAAQNVVVYRPVVPVPVFASPVVVQRPVFAAYAQPVFAQRPFVAYRAPVTTAAYSVRPYTAYAPAVPTVTRFVAVAPAVYAAPVVVRPKVYVPGRPVRNFFQAITP